MNPYAARMKAMLIFAFFPLVVLLAQPLGTISPWLPVIMIGIGGAAHQSWSANIFSTVSDMFPKTAIASITGIGGMAGGFGSMILQKVAGNLFVYASGSTIVDGNEVEMTPDLLAQGAQFVRPAMEFMGFSGKPAGYFIIFCVCAVALSLLVDCNESFGTEIQTYRTGIIFHTQDFINSKELCQRMVDALFFPYLCPPWKKRKSKSLSTSCSLLVVLRMTNSA